MNDTPDKQERAGYAAAKATNDMLRLMLERRKAGLDMAAKRIAEALKAKVVKTAQFKGKITDEKKYTDHDIRLTASKMVVDIFDAFPDKRSHITLHKDLEEMTDDQLEKEMADLEIEAGHDQDI
jgi:hypothetical protein